MEVIQLFIDVVTHHAVGITAALRLEDAHRPAFALHGMILFVHGDEVLVIQDHRRRVPG
jgi:hypothetical protein